MAGVGFEAFHADEWGLQVIAAGETTEKKKGETAVKTEEYSATMQQAMGTCKLRPLTNSLAACSH